MSNEQMMAKADFWGDTMGRNMAGRCSRRFAGLFNEAELAINAQTSADNQAIEYHVPSHMQSEWKATFVARYSAGYRAYLKEKGLR